MSFFQTSKPYNKAYGIAVITFAVLLILLIAGYVAQSLLPKGSTMRRASVGDVAGYPTVMPEARDMALYETLAVESKGMIAPRPPIFDGSGAGAKDRAKIGEKIIKTGSLILRVDSAEKRMTELNAIVDNAGGFIAQANLTDNAGVKTAYVTLRIPADKYEATVAQVKALASTIFSESSSGEDVTSQFVDLEARLKAAKAEETQYLEILKKAGTIEDTLAVTERLAEVRSRIEQMEGEKRYLEDRTDFATLSITMTEETKVEVPTRVWRPFEVLKESLRALVVSLQGLVDVLIMGGVFLLGLLLPILLVLGLAGWLLRKLWKRLVR